MPAKKIITKNTFRVFVLHANNLGTVAPKKYTNTIVLIWMILTPHMSSLDVSLERNASYVLHRLMKEF